MKLRPFALELEHLVGAHSVAEISLDLHALDESFVLDHEAIHDDLIYETPDGELLRWMVLLGRHERDAGHELGTSWAARLGSAMVEVQECAATYLSIKRLDPSMHAFVLAKHSKDYRDRYARLSGVVDRTFESSYLQWLVARVLVDVSLSSPAIEGFWRAQELPTEFGGDRRFELVLAWFSGCAAGLRTQLLDEHGTDIDRERTWTRLSIDERRARETILRGQLHDFVEAQAPATLPILARANWPTTLTSFASELFDRFGSLERAMQHEWPLFDALEQALGPARCRRALRESKVRIELRRAVDPNSLPQLDRIEQLAELTSVALVREQDDPTQWLVAERSSGRVKFVARLNATCSELAQAELEPGSIVLVSTDPPTDERLADDRALRELERRGVEVCVYLRGHYLTWIEWLASQPGARLGIKFLSGLDHFELLSWDGVAHDAEASSTVSMHISSALGLPGIGLRLKPTKASSSTYAVEVALAQLGTIEAGCTDRELEIAARATTLARAWKRW